MKLAIIYDSKSGNTAKMAECIMEGIQSVGDTEVKSFRIDQVDAEYVHECKAVIVGTPTYNGYLTARMKAWLETEAPKLKLAGKLAGSYATAAYIHGGADLAIQCVLTHLMIEGMMTYSSGQSKGAPVIHLGPVAIMPKLDEFAELFKIYGKRMAEQAMLID